VDLMVGFIVLVAAASHLAPHVTPRDIFFSVTVSPDFRDSPAAHAIRLRYGATIWFLAFAAAAFVVTSPMPMVSGPMLLAQTLGASVAFAHARRAVLPHGVLPATIREAEIGPRPGLPGGLAGQLGPFLILVAAAAYVALNWEDVPAPFATHWNLAGTPDGWTRKSVAGVFRGMSIGLVVCAMMWFTSYAVLHWTRLPRVSGREGQRNRHVRRVNLAATLASEYLVALLIAWTAVVSMFSGPDARPRLPLAFRVAPFVLLIAGVVAIRVVRRTAATEGAAVGDTTPDACWIFGQLYVNRRDPALFVEKRMGLGYTLNMGNPLAWLVVTVFVTGIAIPLLLVP
jgi:hypothetical protein